MLVCHAVILYSIFLCTGDDARLLGLLLKHFGKQSFKEWQLKVIQGVLEGRNALVVQPTGSGKSLCFQFPTVVTGKMTVVLVPTISLMLDQVAHLKSSSLKATFLGSAQTDPTTESQVAQGNFDIVFCTPESFLTSTGEPRPLFRSLAAQQRIGLIALDEAHLIRTWRTFRYNNYGHD